MHKRSPITRLVVVSWVATVAFVFALVLVAASVLADIFPPLWGGGAGAAVHYAPVAWPNDATWISYTQQANDINDPKINDPSNGGTTPQNYVNVSSGCTDQTLPSVYWQYSAATQTIFFRWRVEQIANTYGTGPNPGAFSSSDPWNSALWTVLIDIDGDGYREFAVHLNGSSGSPSEQIDVLTGIYSNTPSQSIDYLGDPANIKRINHNPTAFIDNGTNRILNFRNSLNASPNWPNGSSETVWDYGTTRSTQLIKSPTCNEYFVDYQIPLAFLNASAVGGPVITVDTPIAFLFATANSLQNPLQKDVVARGDYIANPSNPSPYGDYIKLTGDTLQQPIVNSIAAAGCNTTTLTANVIETLRNNGTTTVTAVDFYAYADLNANGLADDAQTWTVIANASTNNNPVGNWTATWNSTALSQGQYLIGVQATDDITLNADGKTHRTFSYLSAAEVAALVPPGTEVWYANPSPVPGVKFTTFVNTCGAPPPSISKTANVSSTTAGSPVQFTITITNPTAADITVSQIQDTLPAGFTFVSTDGGTISAPTTSPANGNTGAVLWTFAPAATVPAASSRTLIFTANAGTVVGTYTNTASATASTGSLLSAPIQIGVGAPRLTILKAANVNSASPGDTVTFTITYANNSPVNVTGATITDILPTGITFVSATGGGSYDGGTRTITWPVGGIQSGDGPYTVSFTATVDNPYPGGATIPFVNTATITSNETAPASASSSTYINAPRPSVAIQKDANPAQVAAGGSVTFTIDYANTGNQTATSVTLSDTIPAGFTFVSATNGGSHSGGVVTWNIGTLAANATGSVQVTLQAGNPFSGTNPATNTVTMTTAETAPVSDSFIIGVTQSGSVCSTYYFRNITANMGFDGTRRIANSTAPTSGAAATVVFNATTTPAEAIRFYQDPATGNDVPFSGPVTTTFYIDKSNGPQLRINAYVYDYDPATGGTTLLGSQNFTETGGGSNVQFTFSVTATGTLLKGHRLLWVFEAFSNQSTTFTFRFDGTASPSNAAYCVTPPANLIFDKQVSALSVIPGNNLVYTLRFSNIGQTNATGAQIIDTLPNGTTFVSATLNGAPVAPAAVSGQQYTFNVNSSDTATAGQVTGGQNGTLAITATVDANLSNAVTSLTNNASLQSNQTTAVNDSAVTGVVRPNVTITKSVNNTLLIAGNTATYTLVVTNNGNANATNVTINDVLPATAYYAYIANSATLNSVTVAPDPVAANTLNLNIGSLAVGASATVTFQMQVANSGVPDGVTTLDNTATVSNTETAGTRSSETITVFISTNPNLRITKSSNPAAGPVAAGSSLVYTLTVSNIGSGDATDVVVSDPMPTYTSYVAGTLTDGGAPRTDAPDIDSAYFDAVNNRAIFRVGTLSGGTSRTLTFTARVNGSLPNGASNIPNTATVTAGNAATKQASSSITATAGPNLTLLKTAPGVVPFPMATLSANASASTTLVVDSVTFIPVGSVISVNGTVVTVTAISGNSLTVSAPVTAAAGTQVLPTWEYVLSYANNGTADATGVVISDTLPAGLSFISADNGGTIAGSTVTWNIGTVSVGQNSTVRVRVRPSSAGQFNNGATIDSNETTPVASNTTITIAGALQPSKSTSTPSVQNSPSGTTATYTITIANPLPFQVNSVAVTDILSPGFTYASTVGFGGNATRISTVNPTAGDAQPTWGAWNIPAGGTLTITFVANIAPTVGAGTYQNEMTASSGNAGALSFDFLNTTAEDVTVTQAGPPDLEVTKSDALFTDADANGSPSPGDALQYTVTINNVGGQSATNVFFNDLPDNNTALVVGSVATSAGSVTTGNTGGDTSVSVNVGTIAAAGSVTITFRVTIDNPLPAGITQVSNQGTVSSSELPVILSDDPAVGGASDPTLTPVTATPILTSSKTDALFTDADSNGTPSPGDTLEYTVTIRNNGNIAASGVTFSDTPGANTSLVVGSVTTSAGSVTSGNSGGNTTVGVNIGNLAGGGASVTITFRVAVANPLPAGVTQVANQGRVNSNEVPPVLTDDPAVGGASDPTVTPLTAAPILIASKTDILFTDADSDGVMSPGDTLLYQVVISNNGNIAASGIVFNDTPDPNTALVVGSVQTTSGSVTTGNTGGNTTVSVSIGALAGGASATVTFRVTIDNPIAAGVTQVQNQGTVTSAELPVVFTDDPALGGTADPTISPVTASPLVRSTKTDSIFTDADLNGVPSPGDTLLYQIVVSNIGNQSASNVVVSDTPDPNTTLVIGSVQTTFGAVTSGNNGGDTTVGVNIGTLGAGSVTISFRVIINAPLPAGVTQLANQALISGGNFPTLLSDDPDTLQPGDPTRTAVVAAPVLSSSKSDSLFTDADANGVVSPGDTLLYQVVIVNSGNAAASNIVFTDSPDTNTALVVGSVQTTTGTVVTGNGGGNTTVRVDIGTLAGGGGGATITFRVTVDNPIAPGVTQVSNQGLITSAELPAVRTDDPTLPGSNDPTISPVTAAPLMRASKVDALFTDADSNGIVSPGDVLNYIVSIQNTGNTAATNVTFTDTPGANTSLVVGSVATSLGSVTTGNTGGDSAVAVSIGTVPAGATVSVSFRVTIANPVGLGVTQVSNQGSLAGSNFSTSLTDDPDTLAQSDPTATPVTAAPIVSASMVDALYTDTNGDGFYGPGDVVLYLVTLRNTGNTTASGVQFNVAPDANSALVVGSVQTGAGSVTSGNAGGNTAVGANIGDIPVGGSVTLSFRVTVNNSLPPGVSQLVAQGTVSGSNFSNVLTNDTDVAGTNNPTATPLVSAPPTATPTATATSTSTPTSTNAPTSTSAPTATPTSTPTSTPTPTFLVVDPAVTKASDVNEAAVGDEVTFTLWVTNPGSIAANNVVVVDPIASSLDILGATTTRGTTSIDPATNTVTITVGTVNPGDIVTIVVRTRVNSNAHAVAYIANVATLSHNANNTTYSEQSNMAGITLIGVPKLPVTGEAAPLPQSEYRWPWLGDLFRMLASLLFSLAASLLWAYALWGDHHRAWHRRAGRGEELRRVAITLVPSILATLVMVISLNFSVIKQAVQTGVAVSAPSVLPEAANRAVVIVATAQPEAIEFLPDYPLPPPPANAPGIGDLPPDTSAVTRIVIPDLAADLEVKYVPFADYTWNVRGLRQEVAWLGNTSYPGIGGNTVLAAHVVLRGGVPGPFNGIDKLPPGSEIRVFTDQKQYVYVVREQRAVEPSEMWVVQQSDAPQLTLLTCTEWDPVAQVYRKRLAVVAELVAVEAVTLARGN